jgi:enoyl-CoA hydratase/carnithine racemase
MRNAFVSSGGSMPRLPRLIGRGRAREILVGADDIRGDVAKLYGYGSHAVSDAELDAFVDALAMRIASFDKAAIAETKRLVNVASLPSDAETGLNGTLSLPRSNAPPPETGSRL